MWQFAYMWSIIPTSVASWITHIVIVLGIIGMLASWFARWIPFFVQYQTPLKILGVFLLLGGVYLKGGQDVELAWRARVAEYEERVARAEQESRDANEKLKKALKEKNKDIREAQEKIRERIKKDAKKIDAECKITPETVDILNDSARKKQGKVIISK